MPFQWYVVQNDSVIQGWKATPPSLQLTEATPPSPRLWHRRMELTVPVASLSNSFMKPYGNREDLFFVQCILLFLVKSQWLWVSVQLWGGDELCGLRRLSEVLQVVIIVVEKHAVLPLLLLPLLRLNLQIHNKPPNEQCFPWKHSALKRKHTHTHRFVRPLRQVRGHAEALSRPPPAGLSDSCAPGGTTRHSSYWWRISSSCEALEKKSTRQQHIRTGKGIYLFTLGTS